MHGDVRVIAHDLTLNRASVLDVILPHRSLLWLNESHNVLCSLDNILLSVHMGFQQGFFQGFLVGLWVFLVLDQGCLCVGFAFKLALDEGFESFFFLLCSFGISLCSYSVVSLLL